MGVRRDGFGSVSLYSLGWPGRPWTQEIYLPPLTELKVYTTKLSQIISFKNYRLFLNYLSCLFFGTGWPWLYCVAEDDLTFVLFLCPPPRCWDRCTTTAGLYNTGDLAQDSCMLGRRSTNWATSPAPRQYLYISSYHMLAFVWLLWVEGMAIGLVSLI